MTVPGPHKGDADGLVDRKTRVNRRERRVNRRRGEARHLLEERSVWSVPGVGSRKSRKRERESCCLVSQVRYKRVLLRRYTEHKREKIKELPKEATERARGDTRQTPTVKGFLGHHTS